jgi:hypothetical protein
MNRMRALLLVLAASLACPVCAQDEGPIAVLKEETLDLSRPFGGAQAARLELQVHAVYFSGGGWEREVLVESLREGVPLLAQCGVQLAHARLVLVDAPRKYQFYFAPVSREFARRAAFPTPTVYFVRDTLNHPGFDAEAIGLANSRTRPELANSVWVTLGTPDLAIALAHELAHVLMDSGEHSAQAGNLMRADTAPGNTVLDANQCERLRRRGLQNGLLR